VGVSATSSVGALDPADVMGLTGVSATSAIGSLSFTIDVTVIPTGVSATSAVAVPFIIHYADVDTGSNTSYTNVATGSNTSYSDVTGKAA